MAIFVENELDGGLQLPGNFDGKKFLTMNFNANKIFTVTIFGGEKVFSAAEEGFSIEENVLVDVPASKEELIAESRGGNRRG